MERTEKQRKTDLQVKTRQVSIQSSSMKSARKARSQLGRRRGTWGPRET